MPGLFNVNGDVCELVGSLGNDKPNVLKSVLLQLDTSFLETYKSIIHPCPYSVSLKFLDFQEYTLLINVFREPYIYTMFRFLAFSNCR
jgi:hypothetical protein